MSVLVKATSPSDHVSSTAKWGEGFDLIGHGGQELELTSAKCFAQHLSSRKSIELIEIRVVQIWAHPMPLPMPLA